MTGAMVVVWILVMGSGVRGEFAPVAPQMFADRNTCLVVKEAVLRVASGAKGECIEARVILPIGVVR